MSVYFDPKGQSWVVQLQRSTPDGRRLRKTQRIRGSRKEAERLEATLKKDLDAEIQQLEREHARTEERVRAVEILGVQLPGAKGMRNSTPPRLLDYLTGRWAQHAAVVQNATTLRTTRSHVAYLHLYLGDLRIDQVDEAAVARLREGLLRDGPRAFKQNRNGEFRKPRTSTFRPMAVNRILATLAAALRLAERERVIDRAPAVDLLPSDDSEPLVPPNDDELAAIVVAAAGFVEIAPLMREAITLAAETGMRAGEQFALRWRSVDLAMGETGAIRIEKQPGVRTIDGKPWVPKHKKSRTIALTERARRILLDLREHLPNGPTNPVIPSRGGSPYVRLEAAPDKAGKGYFGDVVEAADIGRHVRWHDLRHYFAVRALLRGVPIAVVSAWLGHSDVNLTVKRYGRWASETRAQWDWARVMSGPPGTQVQVPQWPPIGGFEATRDAIPTDERRRGARRSGAHG